MTQGVGILTVSVAWRQLSYPALKITRFGGSLQELAPHFLKLYNPVPSLRFEGVMGNHPIPLALVLCCVSLWNWVGRAGFSAVAEGHRPQWHELRTQRPAVHLKLCVGRSGSATWHVPLPSRMQPVTGGTDEEFIQKATNGGGWDEITERSNLLFRMFYGGPSGRMCVRSDICNAMSPSLSHGET